MQPADGDILLPPKEEDIIPTGCTLLDCILGGGWFLGHTSLIYGLQSTGKTHLALEAVANFQRKFPDGRVVYVETEGAIDLDHDTSRFDILGIDLDGLELVQNTYDEEGKPVRVITVEYFIEFVRGLMKDKPTRQPLLLVLDSLDCLPSEADLESAGKGETYGLERQKKLSQFFRIFAGMFNAKRTCFLSLAQVRENIGFGYEKYRRSGGMALNFAVSHSLFLQNTGKIEVTHDGIKMPIGITVKATLKKNKLNRPYASVVYHLLFDYGIDDVLTCIEYLESVKRLDVLADLGQTKRKLLSARDSLEGRELRAFEREVAERTKKVWEEIDEKFAIKRRKYD